MVNSNGTTGADVLQTVKAGKGSAFGALVARLWWLWVAIAIAVAVIFWFVGREQDTGPQYQSLALERRDFQASVTATGRVQPLDQVEVGAELSGRVAKVHVDYNEQVKAGQLLCLLDDEQWRATRDQAQAQLQAARAEWRSRKVTLQETRLSVDRTKALAERGVEAPQVLDNAVAALHRAEAAEAASTAQVALAKANLSSAETSLNKTKINSPIDGVVLSRTVEEGQTVAASFNTPVLFVLARDLTQMELTIDIDEADVGQVAVGQQASFTVDAFPNRIFAAELVAIHNIAQELQNVVTYEGVLRVSNDELLLRPGMTATVTIVTAIRERALLVPNAALRFTPPEKVARAKGGPPMLMRSDEKQEDAVDVVTDEPLAANHGRVWVMDAGQPRPHIVTLGLSDGEHSEVTGGDLSEGTQVLVDVVGGQE